MSIFKPILSESPRNAVIPSLLLLFKVLLEVLFVVHCFALCL